MQGFDPKFRDFPDYILGATQEIWEQRGLASAMAAYMHPEVIHRSALGMVQGEGAVTAAAMSHLVEFPDRQLLGEDVIWSGRPQVGLLSSHRSLTVATHRGSGVFGPATGRPVRYRTMIDSYAKSNQISDVWEVRDTSALLAQLDVAVPDWARARLQHSDGAAGTFHPEDNVIGPYTGRGNDNQWGQAFADLLERIMTGELSVITEQYDRACHLCYPGGAEPHGRGAADTMWLGLRAAFPSARFEIHHQVGLEEPLMPPRAALRWSLTGRHEGWGRFGRPSGAHVHVMGISHAEFGPAGVRREWTLFDEAAVWLQVLAQTGA